jgi:hypothetical protein
MGRGSWNDPRARATRGRGLPSLDARSWNHPSHPLEVIAAALLNELFEQPDDLGSPSSPISFDSLTIGTRCEPPPDRTPADRHVARFPPVALFSLSVTQKFTIHHLTFNILLPAPQTSQTPSAPLLHLNPGPDNSEPRTHNSELPQTGGVLSCGYWEEKVVETETKREGFSFWHRNPQQPGQSSLDIAYLSGEQYGIVRPYFIFLATQADGTLVADIVDPHLLHLADALPRLQGLVL